MLIGFYSIITTIPFSIKKTFYDKSGFLNHILKEKVPTVPKKGLRLGIPYLGTISLQTRINCKRPSKGYLTVVNYKLFSKSQNKLCNYFRFKDSVPQILTSGVD